METMMIQEKAICNVCDHNIVAGVACDGTTGECPSQVAQAKKQHQTPLFAATVDRVTGESDFDCVKGID